MLVFKFGGASVKDSKSVTNVAKILREYSSEKLLVVISAMGKTTNLLESILATESEEKRSSLLLQFKNFHLDIAKSLSITDDFKNFIEERVQHITGFLEANKEEFFRYDEIVSQGELASTYLIHLFLINEGFESHWLDAREIIKTQEDHKTTQVNWEESSIQIKSSKASSKNQKLIITQGFIGSNKKNETTTLGREGSDFSAAIFAHLLDAESVTVWKDVPGMLNADPRKFQNTIKLNQISYREAIELAYYGASVIHPKTVKPLQNKKIPLYIKSFIDPREEGTVITDGVDMIPLVPSFISKREQILVSFTPRDFSFIGEKELSEIFKVLSDHKIAVNLMQNSAISFSIVFNQARQDLESIRQSLDLKFSIRFNKGLELLTIRHYNEHIIKELTNGRNLLLEQRSRNTVRLIMDT
tara:strand:+ start:21540 stop:22784 length:1245 start_codon:yes stop_codon:yes gene_type:complete